MLAAIFAMLVVGSFADESMQALAADDESVAINLLQHKGTAQAEADDVEEMVDAEMAVEMSAPGAAFLEEGEGRFRCGKIYCADTSGTSCCQQPRSAICCGPGFHCRRGKRGLAMCM
ncbi:unnamed protein product [Symbiodinium necroappetens]|uniref:Granulins domain-containing protein n=1 Tax=Symbiodinium necroappetens TaxID=1628268 RepID=A0A812Q9B1_9DINO|nr:unnamed protein product [Symbiodinium necroappetens]